LKFEFMELYPLATFKLWIVNGTSVVSVSWYTLQ